MINEPKRFTAVDSRFGYLAVHPKALTLAFTMPSSRANARIGDVEVVEIEGPLMDRDPYFDSYASIKDRVRQACMSDASKIVMLIRSPGGMVHDCFATSRQLKAMCAEAGKPLVAFIDDIGCSAAYALATAAGQIFCHETATVGSVGVISARVDVTEMMARDGFKVSYIASGSKKSFGNPETQLTEEELAETQRQINTLAGMFFNLVQEQRPGLSAVQVASYEAGTFIGGEAVAAGLVDQVCSFESLFMSSATVSERDSNNGEPVSLAEVIEALKAMSEGEGDDADKAKSMLKAMEPSEPSDDGDKEPDPKDPKEDEESAKAELPEEEDKKADSLAQDVAALKAELEALKAAKHTNKPVAVGTLPQPAAAVKSPKDEEEIMLDKAFGLHVGPAAVEQHGSVIRFPVIGKRR